MKQRFKLMAAGFLVLEKDGKVLLLRRFNTGYAMVLPSYESTNFQHVRVHEAKRHDPMTMDTEVLVCGYARKVLRVVLVDPVIYLAKGLLLTDRQTNKQVEDENSDHFAVTENWGTTNLFFSFGQPALPRRLPKRIVAIYDVSAALAFCLSPVCLHYKSNKVPCCYLVS